MESPVFVFHGGSEQRHGECHVQAGFDGFLDRSGLGPVHDVLEHRAGDHVGQEQRMPLAVLLLHVA